MTLVISDDILYVSREEEFSTTKSILKWSYTKRDDRVTSIELKGSCRELNVDITKDVSGLGAGEGEQYQDQIDITTDFPSVSQLSGVMVYDASSVLVSLDLGYVALAVGHGKGSLTVEDLDGNQLYSKTSDNENGLEAFRVSAKENKEYFIVVGTFDKDNDLLLIDLASLYARQITCMFTLTENTDKGVTNSLTGSRNVYIIKYARSPPRESEIDISGFAIETS